MRVWVLEVRPNYEQGNLIDVYSGVGQHSMLAKEFGKQVAKILQTGRSEVSCMVNETTGETYVQNGCGDGVYATAHIVRGISGRNAQIPLNALVTMVQTAVKGATGFTPTTFDGGRVTIPDEFDR